MVAATRSGSAWEMIAATWAAGLTIQTSPRFRAQRLYQDSGAVQCRELTHGERRRSDLAQDLHKQTRIAHIT